MSLSRLPVAATLAVALGASASGRVQAETWHTCAGFIDALPAVITQQGTWCLRSDRSTSVSSGAAITIAANNVTIDCNGYKLGGLGAGTGTEATGILAVDRLNATIRNCAIRGFAVGVSFGETGGGHLVEDNRFDAIRVAAIEVYGDGSMIRRNGVFDSGGSTAQSSVFGIATNGAVDIRDNVIDGMVTNADLWAASTVTGIYPVGNDRGTVIGNRVGGLVSTGAGSALGIFASGSDAVTIRDNILIGDGRDGGIGILCSSATGVAIDNVVQAFPNPVLVCSQVGTVP